MYRGLTGSQPAEPRPGCRDVRRQVGTRPLPHRQYEPIGRDGRGAVACALGRVRPLEQLVERRRLAIDQSGVPPHLVGELEEPHGATRGEHQAGAHEEQRHTAGAPPPGPPPPQRPRPPPPARPPPPPRPPPATRTPRPPP